MQLRTYRTSRNGKTYEYLRLVESYRREDGKPTHRILAKLPAMSAQQAANIRAALEANRRGAAVTIAPIGGEHQPETSPGGSNRAQVLANLRYLDIAVLDALWRQLGLKKLLDDLMPARGSEVPAESVVAALTIQRCVAPGSKLFAERWVPRTALPELHGVAPEKFNNTRIHRVLAELDRATPMLMRSLARNQSAARGGFAALFLDVSDARFVGRGPETAEKTKSKEGIYGRKIGVVLLCADDGMPLRWAVVPGRQHDSKSMDGVLQDIAGLSWTKDVPVVCDRAMGTTQQLCSISALQMRFLTALSVTEFGTYAPKLPHQPFQSCAIALQDETFSDDVALIAKTAVEAGFERVSDTLFVLDQGVLEPPSEEVDWAEQQREGQEQDEQDKTVGAMRSGLAVAKLLRSGQATNYRAAGLALGLTKDQAAHWHRLTKLNEDIQEDVLSGKATGLSINDLKRVAALPAAAQPREFERLVRDIAPRRDARRARKGKRNKKAARKPVPPRVRIVAALNPELMVQKRRNLIERHRQLQHFAKQLNEDLAKPTSRRSRDRIVALVGDKLRQLEMRDLYTANIREVPRDNGTPGFQVDLVRDPAVWQRRHRYAGFTILAAHPETRGTPGELAQLYRAKDQVEKDFHIIKSLVEIRPVWHYTDPKVRAHVTVCMLALALEREMTRRLRAAGIPTTAAAALELLEDCRLNRIAIDQQAPCYQITQPDHQQRHLVRGLALEHLLDDQEMADRIHPR